MIFGRMSKEGRQFVMVGLSEENLAVMKAGKPLSIGPIPFDELMQKVTIFILAAETDEAAVDMLKASGLMPPETPVKEG